MRKLRIALGFGLIALALAACLETMTLGVTLAVISLLTGLGLLTPSSTRPAKPMRPVVHPCLSMLREPILDSPPTRRAPPPARQPSHICLSEFIDAPHTRAPEAGPAIDAAAIKDKLIARGALPPDVIDRLR